MKTSRFKNHLKTIRDIARYIYALIALRIWMRRACKYESGFPCGFPGDSYHMKGLK